VPRGALEEAAAPGERFSGRHGRGGGQGLSRGEAGGRTPQLVLAVIGEKRKERSPFGDARHKMLLTWLPNAEGFVLPGATHLLYLENPRDMAESLTAFFARHPLKAR